jgi:pyruvate/2-oxoacid:ferredoxin oxidoreductase alpha subunit
MRKLMNANYAAAHAAKLCRVEVMAAYPITPQTSIIEKLAEFCDTGQMPARLLRVESEHSAMAACVGAATGGARVFTATAGQGIAFMHEMLHWAAGARLPIVMVEVNRALGTPWTLATDQNDSLSQRDTGWLQLYCRDAQEVLDTVIQAYKIAERVLLPVMVVLDGFILSHTSEPVDLPDVSSVDAYLGPKRQWHHMDLDDPRAFGGFASPEPYLAFRKGIQQAMDQSLAVVTEAGQQFGEVFGRSYGLLEEYRLDDDPETVLVATSTISSTARVTIDLERAAGRRVGLLRIRCFRPFPKEQVRRALAGSREVIVIDRNISFGHGGVFCQEVKSALYGYAGAPVVFGYVAGLGGSDVTPGTIADCIDKARAFEGVPGEIMWAR